MVNPNKKYAEYVKEIRSKGFAGEAYAGPNEYDSGQLTAIVPDGVELKSLRCGNPASAYKFPCIHSRGRDLPKKPRFIDGLPEKN